MRKVILLITLIMNILCFCNTSFAYPNEPENFRNFVWGESVDSVRSKYPSLADPDPISDKVTMYTIGTNEEYLGNIPIYKAATVSFYENQLADVSSVVVISNKKDFLPKTELVLTELASMFGKWTGERQEKQSNGEMTMIYEWIGAKTNVYAMIDLKADENKNNIIIQVSSSKFSQKLLEDDKKNTKVLKRGW